MSLALSTQSRNSKGKSLPIPPDQLMFRVGGHKANLAEDYVVSGRECCESIGAALAQIGRPWSSLRSVLDLGCGCARTIAWVAQECPAAKVHGCDADKEAIAWCRAHVPAAEFTVNTPLPPTPYRSGQFDFIYLISVFTHLDLEWQAKWLAELKRITAPGGIVLITTHGLTSAARLTPTMIDELNRQGILFLKGHWKGHFPDWYGSTFQTPQQAVETFAPYFDVLAHLPHGLNNFQDVALLQNSGDSPAGATRRPPALLLGPPSQAVSPTEDLRRRFEQSRDVRLAFDVATGAKRLTPIHEVSVLQEAGRLVLRSHGVDPHLLLPEFPTARAERFIVRLEISSPEHTMLDLFHATKTAPGFSPARRTDHFLAAGRNVVYLEVAEPNLAGRLRLDPGLVAGDFELTALEVRAG